MMMKRHICKSISIHPRTYLLEPLRRWVCIPVSFTSSFLFTLRANTKTDKYIFFWVSLNAWKKLCCDMTFIRDHTFDTLHNLSWKHPSLHELKEASLTTNFESLRVVCFQDPLQNPRSRTVQIQREQYTNCFQTKDTVTAEECLEDEPSTRHTIQLTQAKITAAPTGSSRVHPMRNQRALA